MFKQRKPKQFSYKPRFNKDGNIDVHDDLKSRWEEIRDEVRDKTTRNVAKPLPLRTLILLLVLMAVALYVLDSYIN